MALASTTDAGQLVVYTEDNNTGFPLGADDVARSPVLTTCKTGTISVPFPSRAVASWLTGSPGVDTSPPDLVDVVKLALYLQADGTPWATALCKALPYSIPGTSNQQGDEDEEGNRHAATSSTQNTSPRASRQRMATKVSASEDSGSQESDTVDKVLMQQPPEVVDAVLACHPVCRGSVPLSQQLKLLPPAMHVAVCRAHVAGLTAQPAGELAFHVQPWDYDWHTRLLPQLASLQQLRALSLEVVDVSRHSQERRPWWALLRPQRAPQSAAALAGALAGLTQLTALRLTGMFVRLFTPAWLQLSALTALSSLHVVVNKLTAPVVAHLSPLLRRCGALELQFDSHSHAGITLLADVLAAHAALRELALQPGGKVVAEPKHVWSAADDSPVESEAASLLAAARAGPHPQNRSFVNMWRQLCRALRACTQLTALRMWLPGADETLAMPLAPALCAGPFAHSLHLASLSLRDCSLFAVSTNALAGGLYTAPLAASHLTALDLSCTRCGENQYGEAQSLAHLARALRSLHGLQDLNLSVCNLTGHHMAQLSSGLATMSQLRRLDLSDNDLDEAADTLQTACDSDAQWPYSTAHPEWGFKGVVSAACDLTKLTCLVVLECSLGARYGELALVLHALSATLQTFRIGDRGTAADHGKAMLALVPALSRCAALRAFDCGLSFAITAGSCAAFAAALAQLTNMTRLELMIHEEPAQAWSEEQVSALADAVSRLSCLCSLGVQLSSAPRRKRGAGMAEGASAAARVVAAALPHATALTDLMTQSELCGRGMQVASALPALQRLEKFEAINAGMSEEELDAVCASAARLPELRFVSLSGNGGLESYTPWLPARHAAALECSVPGSHACGGDVLWDAACAHGCA